MIKFHYFNKILKKKMANNKKFIKLNKFLFFWALPIRLFYPI